MTLQRLVLFEELGNGSFDLSGVLALVAIGCRGVEASHKVKVCRQED